MRLQHSKLANSCLLTAIAMVLDVDQWWLHRFLDLPDPNTSVDIVGDVKRGFCFEEFQIKLLKYDIGFAPYSPKVIHPIYPYTYVSCDLDDFERKLSLLMMIEIDSRQPHAIAYDGELYYDPKGLILSLEAVNQRYILHTIYLPFEFRVGALNIFRGRSK